MATECMWSVMAEKRRGADRRTRNVPPTIERRTGERRRGGRPPLPPEERLDSRIRVSCTELEALKLQLFAMLVQPAREVGRWRGRPSVSGLARDILLDQVNEHLADSSRNELVRLLRSIGVEEDTIAAVLASI